MVGHQFLSLQSFGQQSLFILPIRFSAMTDEIRQRAQHTLDRLARNLPMSIGYTWEGGTTVNTAPIQLRDMYNHVVDVPLDLCATLEVLYLSVCHEYSVF